VRQFERDEVRETLAERDQRLKEEMEGPDEAVQKHLRELEERNRVRKAQESQRMSQRERRKLELERGFSMHFRGANEFLSTSSSSSSKHVLPRNSNRRHSMTTAEVRKEMAAFRRRNAAEDLRNTGSKILSGKRRGRKQWGELVDPLLGSAENAANSQNQRRQSDEFSRLEMGRIDGVEEEEHEDIYSDDFEELEDFDDETSKEDQIGISIEQKSSMGDLERITSPSKTGSSSFLPFLREKPITTRSSPIYSKASGSVNSGGSSLSRLLDQADWDQAANRGMFEQSKPKKMRPKGRQLIFNFTDTWGDIYYMGLTGLALLVREANGKLRERYPLRKRIKANPSDININGHHGDPRTLDKVIDGTNNTNSEHHMWLIEFNPNQNHTLEIDLGSDRFELAGLRVWNYNKNLEDTRRGVRVAQVSLDGKQLSPPGGIIFRRAPGIADIDFGQTILFEVDAFADSFTFQLKEAFWPTMLEDQLSPKIPAAADASRIHSPSSFSIKQDWEVLSCPCGYILRFDFHANHGDSSRIGIEKIEVFDMDGQKLSMLSKTQATGKGSFDANWKSPWTRKMRSPAEHRRIFFSFDRPIVLGSIEITNFSEKPTTGASEVSIFMDSQIIYVGELRCGSRSGSRPQEITFNVAKAQAAGENIHYCGRLEQNVVFIDNRNNKKF